MTVDTWSISELAREFHITPRTLRFYEDRGILSPHRDGQNRIYTARDRARLRLALRGRRLGLQLSEIVNLINLYDRSPASSTAQLQEYARVLATHRHRLEQQRRDIDQTLAEIRQQENECATLLQARLASSPPSQETSS